MFGFDENRLKKMNYLIKFIFKNQLMTLIIDLFQVGFNTKLKNRFYRVVDINIKGF
jgi:hypothetical protein